LRGWKLVGAALSKARNACDLLDEARLSECERSSRIVSSELDSELFEQPFFLGEFESAVLEGG
jgi:hypothetical protein